MMDIDLFHGVDGGGNCLPGPCRPFGLVHAGPDMINHNTSGYATGELLRHFSHLHWSGAGGVGRHGCIGVVPLGQRPDARSLGFQVLEESAELGCYRARIHQQQGFGELYCPGAIDCTIAATAHTAVHHYQWAEGQEPWLRIDLDTAVGSLGIGAWLRWQDARTLIGRADYRGGWGHEVPFSVFFRMEFSEAMDDRGAWSRYHAMRNDDLGEGIGLACRARVAGEARQVTVSVGISLVSPAGAQRALREELPAVDGRARLDQVIADSTNCWEKLLGRFRVQGGSHDDRVLWNTLWQRIHQIPTRLEPTEVPWFAATETHFNDLVCLWDSSRGANSLLALVDAPHQVSLCRSLIEIGEQTGWIPDAWVMGVPGQIQGGCSAAVLFAEAVRKNLPEFPVDRALAALRHNDETSSPDTGRFGRFPQWQAGDCLPDSVKNHVSRSLEYAFHDRCRSILAQAQGQRDEAQELLQRSERPWQLWHDETQCFGSRSDAGDWNKYDPWRPSCRDFWNDPHFYEGTAQDYTLGAWHLLPGIVERSGGAAAFADRIDAFLERCYHWKEINLHVPWLYHFAGQPQRSSTALRRIADQCVQPGRRGLGDNEDFGAWSSWWLGQAMGLGVIPGSDRYLIAKPRFEQIELDLAGASRPLVIRCVGDGPDIVGMTIDGVAHDDNWLRHGAIADGAEIVLQLGSGGNWGRGMATWE